MHFREAIKDLLDDQDQRPSRTSFYGAIRVRAAMLPMDEAR